MSYNSRQGYRELKYPRSDRRYQDNRSYNKQSSSYGSSGSSYSPAGNRVTHQRQQHLNHQSGGKYSNNSNLHYQAYQLLNLYHNNNNNHNNSHTNTNNSTNNDHLQIWMGDLDLRWGESDILDIWSAQGYKPVSVKIIWNDAFKTSYCFVNFSSVEEVNSAVSRNGTAIPGTKFSFRLNKASDRPRRQQNQNSYNTNNNNSNYGQNQNNNYNRNNNNDYRNYGSKYNNDRFADSHQDTLSLFVGDLASEVTEDDLYQEFNAKYPSEVKLVKIMADLATNTSKGYGFVKFSGAVALKKALREMNGIVIKNKPIRVGGTKGSSHNNSNNNNNNNLNSHTNNHASESPRTRPTSSKVQVNKFTDPRNTTIVIYGLSGMFVEEDIRSMFLSFGDITKIILQENGTQAIVQYDIRPAAEAAILALHKFEFNGYRLVVNWGSETSTYVQPDRPSPSYGCYNVYTSQPTIFKGFEKSEPLSVSDLNSQVIEERSHLYLIFDY